jgi:hypothetical protein
MFVSYRGPNRIIRLYYEADSVLQPLVFNQAENTAVEVPNSKYFLLITPMLFNLSI